MSKSLSELLYLPLTTLALAGVLNVFNNDHDVSTADILLALGGSIPLIVHRICSYLYAWDLNEQKKVRKSHRLVLLPFTPAFGFAFVSIAGLVALIVTLTEPFYPTRLLAISAFVISTILLAVLVDHPRIWFINTVNEQDIAEEVNNTPKENLPAYQDGDFKFYAGEFFVPFGNDAIFIEWSEVDKIVAYKVDLLGYDMIMIEVYTQRYSFTIDEDTIGFMKFMDQASEYLLSFNVNWYDEVVPRAFRTNYTVVFENNDLGEHERIVDLVRKSRWRSYWLSCINELTDIELQQRSWLDMSNTNPHWTYVDFTCSYFDDRSLDDDYQMILNDGWVSAKEFDVVKEWHFELLKYDPPQNDCYDHEAILRDPNWQRVVALGAQARNKLALLLGDKERRYLLETKDHLLINGSAKWP